MELNVVNEKKIATIYSRIASLILDFLIYQIFISPIYFIVWFLVSKSPSSILDLGDLIELGLVLLLFSGSFFILPLFIAFFQFKYGQTFGMKLAGIKIQFEESVELNFTMIFLRSMLVVGVSCIILIVPIYGLFFGPFYLLFLFIYLLLRNNNNPTLIDKLFKTQVIEEKDTRYLSKIVTFGFLTIITILVAILSLFIIDFALKFREASSKKEAQNSNINTYPITNTPNLTPNSYSESYKECMKAPESSFKDKIAFCNCFANQEPVTRDINTRAYTCREFLNQ